MAPECEETLVSYCMYINIYTYAYPPRVRGTAGRICNQDVTSELNVKITTALRAVYIYIGPMLTSRIRVQVREGRATPNYRCIVCFKLCKTVLSSSNSTSTLEVRGKCTCNVMLMAHLQISLHPRRRCH